MDAKVREALWEWAAGLIIGIIPLIAHLVAIGSNDSLPGKEPDWISDILFVVVSTSGASSVSIVSRLLKGELQADRMGKSALGLSAITVVLLVAAATLYGSAAVGHARWWAIWEALGLLAGSLISSLYFEFALASKLAVNLEAP